MKSLAIIGSAGQKTDADQLFPELYAEMCDIAERMVAEFEIEEGVSGGAAVGDHVAVTMFLNDILPKLKLYLPAHFLGGAFVSNGRHRPDPAPTANKLHEAFRESCNVDSLAQIAEAIKKGASVEVFHGFKRRNLEVAARPTHMLAYTFGSKPTADFPPDSPGFLSASAAGLKDGGTAHTWGECWKAELKRHVNLQDLVDELNAA